MATSFPTGIDSFPDPGPSTPMNTPGQLEHDVQHTNINDAMNAVETKIGINGSSDVASMDNKLATVISAQSGNTAAIAANTAAIGATNTTVSGNTTSIAGLVAANPNILSNGQVFVPASATSGTAINAAMATLPAGGTIVLGAGTHTINTAILFDRNLKIKGIQKNAVILSFNPAVVTTAMKMTDTTQRRIDLQDFTILTTTGGTGTAILAAFFVDSVIERVFIGGAAGTSPNVGINFNSGVGQTFYNEVRSCRIFTSGAAPFCIYFDNNANSNAVSHTRLGCVGNSSTGTGVFIDRAYSLLLTHIDMESCDAIGLDVGGNTGASSATTRDITLLNCYFEAITIGLRLASGSIAVTMVGGQFNNCTTADFQDNGCQSARLIGVTLEGHAYGYSSHPASRVIRTAGTYSLTHAEVYGSSALRIRLVGAGGGGGGANITSAGFTSVAGGGQAGAYTEATIRTEDLTYPVSIVIGAGGNGGLAANGTGGTASTFGATIMTAPGGNPGQFATTNNTFSHIPGGQGSNAGAVTAPVSGTTAIILAGGEGEPGIRIAGASIGGWSGGGGVNPLGARTAAPSSFSSAAGRNGYQYGSGGSGGFNNGAAGSANQVGGNGADGACIIELIY
jgi:hypothetical protein